MFNHNRPKWDGFFVFFYGVKEVRLKRGEIALVDDQDFDLVSKFKWFRHKEGYAVSTVTLPDGRKGSLLMHRLILGAKKGQLTDHEDWNRLNNQRYNIRIATQR